LGFTFGFCSSKAKHLYVSKYFKRVFDKQFQLFFDALTAYDYNGFIGKTDEKTHPFQRGK
jgi:hypothetical protein